MKQSTTTREVILKTMEEAMEVAHVEGDQDVATQIREALRWAKTEEESLYQEGEIDDLYEEYISRNQVINLFQSAEEELDLPDAAEIMAAAGPERSDKAKMVLTWIKYRLFRSRADFRLFNVTRDFEYDLAHNATVALVSDWGSGKPGAREVAKRIRERNPDHVIHLGDIYPSGLSSEINKHFVEIWEAYGPAPDTCTYWALNGNHEMISKGHAYFSKVIDQFCQHQEASFFCLRNEYWRLVGIDSAYKDHELYHRQHPWVNYQLLHNHSGDIESKKILLSHHQPFSRYDSRPRKSDHELRDELFHMFRRWGNPPWAWFWGHEHACLAYEPENEFGIKGRCIGNGGKSVKLKHYERVRGSNEPSIKWEFKVAKDDAPEQIRNGFALLEFEGPNLTVTYICEKGEEHERENW